MHHCRSCDRYFSETFATAIAGLRTPLSRIIEVLKARTEMAASDSQGWTIVLMERSSRFWGELDCGRQDEQLFKAALEL